MPECVIDNLEMVEIHHRYTQLESKLTRFMEFLFQQMDYRPPVEHACQFICIGQLLQLFESQDIMDRLVGKADHQQHEHAGKEKHFSSNQIFIK